MRAKVETINVCMQALLLHSGQARCGPAGYVWLGSVYFPVSQYRNTRYAPSPPDPDIKKLHFLATLPIDTSIDNQQQY